MKKIAAQVRIFEGLERRKLEEMKNHKKIRENGLILG